MNVTELIQAAFMQALSQYPDLHATWVSVSYRIGSQLPASTLVSSVQRAGELDILIRRMEDELSSNNHKTDLSFHYQVMLSELWIGHVYEIARLLKDRKRAPDRKDFEILAHHLRLLRISLEKHEIAGDWSLKAPLVMKRVPPNNDASDIYTYAKDDPNRSHIMPGGISKRGSLMWQVFNATSGESFWIERRVLSERLIAIYTDDQGSLRTDRSPQRQAPQDQIGMDNRTD